MFLCILSFYSRGDDSYSLKPIGYVNVAIRGDGFQFLTNPLNVSGDKSNHLSQFFSGVPNDTVVYPWDSQTQAYKEPSIKSSEGWSIDYDLPPGTGFLIHNPWNAFTNTFVGEILTGSLTNFLPGSNRISLVSSIVPQKGQLTMDLYFPNINEAVVSVFDSDLQSFKSYKYYNGYGWYDVLKEFDTNGPVISAGSSFFVENPDADAVWTREFDVMASANLFAKPAFQSSVGTANIVFANTVITPVWNATAERLVTTNDNFKAALFIYSNYAWKQVGDAASIGNPVPGQFFGGAMVISNITENDLFQIRALDTNGNHVDSSTFTIPSAIISSYLPLPPVSLSSMADCSLTVISNPEMASQPGNISFSAQVNTSQKIKVEQILAYATDNNHLQMSIPAVESTGKGTVTLTNGVITYTPPKDFVGLDSFTYHLQNSFPMTTRVPLPITITPIIPDLHKPWISPMGSGTMTVFPMATTAGFMLTATNVDGPWTSIPTCFVSDEYQYAAWLVTNRTESARFFQFTNSP